MFEILRYNDKEKWASLITAIGAEDPYLDPEYLKINEIIIPGELECFVYQGHEAMVLYPYIKRPIGHTGWSDITSPYGFGGFIAFPKGADTSGFHRAFCQYCRDNRIVSEFIRFHPMFHEPGEMEGFDLNVAHHQPVVWVDYATGAAGPEERAGKEVRKKVAKAERNGIVVVEDVERRYWDEFRRLYNTTMSCKGASAFYYFEQTFFRALLDSFGNRSALFVARYEGRVIGGLLSLFSSRFGYNFLSGSDYAYNAMGTNEALQWTALEAARRRRMSAYLLGGGRGGEDSLFRFKAKFSDRRKGFYIGRRIHLPDVYEMICAQQSANGYADLNYFPLYRSASLSGNYGSPMPAAVKYPSLVMPLLHATGEAMAVMQEAFSGWFF
ncbi:MAG: GNAT family N-acetyltransferase [Bryobacteraceae bacterium]|nr:GNAT family N-acetyltransferase [Bryobacteraceae bacterium]